MILVGTLSLFLSASSLPEWTEALKPQASLLLQYEELMESGRDESGFALGGAAGLTFELQERWAFGLEFRIAESGDTEARPDAVPLEGGMNSRPVSLSSLYIAHRPTSWLLVSLGKFEMPFRSTPLVWDLDRHPEGLYEALEWQSSRHSLSWKLHAGQFAMDRAASNLAESEESQRSWLLLEGLELNYRYSEHLWLQSSVQVYHFLGIGSRLSEIAVRRGAQYETEGNELRIKSRKFLPVEVETELSSLPLGIFTSLRAAMVLNARSAQKQRGFLAQARIGRPWKKDNFHSALSFYYNEPMASLAYFSERDFGYANRKAGLFELDYFLTDRFRIGASYLLSELIQESFTQNARQEWRVAMEFRL